MSQQSVPFEARIQALTDRILADYGNERVIDRLEMFTQPDRLVIEAMIEKLFRLRGELFIFLKYSVQFRADHHKSR